MKISKRNTILFFILIFIVFFIIGFVIGIYGIYFPYFNKFEKFSLDNQTYQLVQLTDADKGNMYSSKFDINPLLTETNKTTPLEFENEKVD
jgi:predicted membrane protein